MKTHYELLSLAPGAGPEEIKRAFRREIARYHPDKVQHLGPEFQDIASERAAALTEAYRTLMDPELRRRYDEMLDAGVPEALRAHGPTPHAPPSAPAPPEPEPTAANAPAVDRRFAREQARTTEFVRRAVLAKLNEAATSLGGAPMTGPAFDAMFQIKGKKALFRKPDPTIRLAVKVVPHVDPPAVADAWSAAIRVPASGETICLMLLGSGVSPARDLAAAVSDLRRKSRTAAPVVIPVDVRDWSALLPPETPTTIRGLLDRLRAGM